MSKPRRRAHGAESEEHEGGMERWLLTYADMITLLLALFIILFAMSTISMRKFAEFKTGFVIGSRTDVAAITSGGKGLLQQTSLVSHPGSVQSLQQRAEAALRSLESEIQAWLSSHGVQSDAQ
ncbi:MAG: flagellar motor protein MotB, partial [Acidimicrobiales bacterium]